MELAQLVFRPGSETVVNGDILNFRVFGQLEAGHILLAGFDLVDAELLDLQPLLIGQFALNHVEVGALDDGFRLGVQQCEALHGTVGPLVELSGQELHGEVLQPVQGKLVAHVVGHGFGEDHFLGFGEEILVDIEDVIDLQVAKIRDIKVKVLVQSGFQTVGFDLKALFFLYKDTGVTHNFFPNLRRRKDTFFWVKGYGLRVKV